jgi:D-amino-acid oxidase
MRLNSRRAFLSGMTGLGVMGLGACAAPVAGPMVLPRLAAPLRAPLRLSPDRITHITVCSRPFRAAGPRLDVEMIGDKPVVHNYGHGGSGWSLAWGSSAIAAAKAMEAAAMKGDARQVAVIGCGALGLTSAILLQRAGATVTIHAAERAPQTRSARATGTWSPDSRIADASVADPGFGDQWEAMTRASYAMHRTYVGRDGDPVFWQDSFYLRDAAGDQPAASHSEDVDFAHYGSRVRDLTPRSHALEPGESPFSVATGRLGTAMVFNVAELSRQLTEEFLREGRIQRAIFRSPADLAALAEPVIVNCTGYGARALFGDTTVTPVRGQITWLVPQPEANYGLYYRGVSVLPRPDGIVVQQTGGSDMWGYGLEDETPDRAEAEAAIAAVAPLFA